MRYLIRYWSPALFFASLIFYLSSLPAEAFPEVNIPFADKIVHICLYGTMGFFLCRALTSKRRDQEPHFVPYRSAILGTIGFCILYGISDEIHQIWTPGRSVEVADVVADMIGGIVGATVALLYRRLVYRYEHSPKI